MASKQPTTKQLAYLKALAERTGRTFAWPATSREASVEIRRLKASDPDSGLERRLERQEVAGAINDCLADSARVTDRELTGWGSTATWSQRS